MNNVITQPGVTSVRKILAPSVPGSSLTTATNVMEFAAIQSLLSDKPLRSPIRQTDEEGNDLRASKKAMAEGNVRPFDELLDELGLG